MANETTLFDRTGEATAYVVNATGNIFLWDGTPAAYLESSRSRMPFSVYGFNGEHLAWFDGQLMRDHSGGVIAFVRGAVTNVIPRIEPIKSIKKIIPIKRIKRIEPILPLARNSFSNQSLQQLLESGR